MFKTRLLSGILLVLIALVTIISGGDILFATVLLISLIGMSELYKVLKVHNTLLGVVGYAACIVYYGMIRMGRADMVTLLTIAFLVAIMAVYVCIFISEVSIRTDYDYVFRTVLCGSDVILCLPDARAYTGGIFSVAHYPLFMGM